MSREESHHRPASPPTLATLLPNRTATIRFDGLILGAYNQAKKLYQAGVHLDAEHHHLVITVKKNGGPFWPKEPSDWDSSHDKVEMLAPFWLFVDSGNGLDPKANDASLYKPGDLTDPLSFGNIFSFVRQHGRELQVNLNALAEFNFPQGIAYSAANIANATLKQRKPNDPSTTTVVKERFNVSRLGAIDIADVSDEKTKRELVLIGEGGKREFFRLPLVAGSTYEIIMENRPIHPGTGSAAEHFLQYYELFSLNAGEKEFFVELPRGEGEAEDSPPCVGTSGSGKGGLGGGG